jgi:aminotransferase in exopolysaccharide biosynthesis
MAAIVGDLIKFVRREFGVEGQVHLHMPYFDQREHAYTGDCIDTRFVSSASGYVDRFEKLIREYTGAPSAVVTTNCTAALHTAFMLCGVQQGDLVITQPVTYVSTCNAIRYCGAEPVFVDIEKKTLGMSASALQDFLEKNAEVRGQTCHLRSTGQVIRACVPMHTFGHPVDLDGIIEVCRHWQLPIIEDAAQSLGSQYKGIQTGRFGKVGTISFNGNKIITTAGGGVMLFESPELAAKAKHLSTTAKVPHSYIYYHDEVGYNYRMPSLNAALGCAQIEKLDQFITTKRAIAKAYQAFFDGSEYEFFTEPAGCRSNYWLNAVICPDKASRDAVLSETNAQLIGTRAVWEPMTRLPMYKNCLRGPLDVTEWVADRVVNLPSSVTHIEA